MELYHKLKETIAFNKRIRDNVDLLLAQAGFDEQSSVRNQLSYMNFDILQQNLDLATEYRIELDKLSQRNCELRMENAALKEQSVTEQVAWRTFDGEGGYDYRDYDENENYYEEWIKRNPQHIGWVDRLYTTPQTEYPSNEAIDKMLFVNCKFR